MKPLHSNKCRLRRCPCCQGKHSANGARKQNSGKSAARQQDKREIRREMSQ